MIAKGKQKESERKTNAAETDKRKANRAERYCAGGDRAKVVKQTTRTGKSQNPLYSVFFFPQQNPTELQSN